jgi:hypothetical protein
MPVGWYSHKPGDPFYELDWVFLHEHAEIPAAPLGGGVARGRGVVVMPPVTAPAKT